MLFVGFLEAIEGKVVFTETDVDSGEEVWRDVFARGDAGEVVEDLPCFFCSSGFAVGMCERRAHHRAAA